VVLLEEAGKLTIAGAWPPDIQFDPQMLETAHRAAARDRDDDVGPVPPASQWYFMPLHTQSGSVGVVGVERGPALDGEARALLSTLAEQTAAALERAFLAREMANSRNAAETERVRNILLTSVSHDFRTPLASILGSATSLLEFGDKLADADRIGLLRDIKTEAEGLDDMVRNLLAMTRIDAGALELRRDWVDLGEIAERVVTAARRRGARVSFALNLPPDLPMIAADATLIEQALGNVVNNSVLHTPSGTRVVIDALIAESIALRVTDDGPGIPAEVLPRIFDKFVRAGIEASGRAEQTGGTGLGLAIAKGIVAAHGGAIAAESPVADGRGTRITLTFARELPR
jgi:two-component system sensor histidine kinase KdpD